MAQGASVVIMVAGDANTVQATAVTNFNTAMNTFMTGTAYLANTTPRIVSGGLSIDPDAAVANGKYTAWAVVQYVSAT